MQRSRPPWVGLNSASNVVVSGLTAHLAGSICRDDSEGSLSLEQLKPRKEMFELSRHQEVCGGVQEIPSGQ